VTKKRVNKEKLILYRGLIMDGTVWWDTKKDDSWVNAILKFTVEARKWYLKTDVKVRLKRFILKNVSFEEIVALWKRLQIVKEDFGEEIGSVIIQKAIREIKAEFKAPKWKKIINEKIAKEREGLNDDFVQMDTDS
jgi:hypothetical protein